MPECSGKIWILRDAMAKNGMQAYVVPSSDPHMSEYPPDHWKVREWLSGFTGSAGTVVITAEDACLWTDGRYYIQAEKELSGTGIRLFRDGEAGVPSWKEYLAQTLRAGDTVGFDELLFSASESEAMRDAFEKKGIWMKTADLVSQIWKDRPAIPSTKVFLHEEKYSGLSCAEKLQLVRTELKNLNADGQVFSRLDEIAWLLNLRAEDIAYNPFFVAYAVVLADGAFLFTDLSRVASDVAQTLQENGVTLYPYDAVRNFFKNRRTRETLLVEKSGISCGLYRFLRGVPYISVKEGPDIVRRLKSVKNPVEIENIRRVHVQDGCAMVRCFTALEEKLQKGASVTEYDVCTMLRKCRTAQPGNRGESFATIAAYRENAAMMHYEPGPDSCRKLEREGLLLVDSGGQYLGGTTDITRTFALGPLTREEMECYTVVLQCHIALATAVFREGSTGGNIDILCREPLWRRGIDYRCGTGHGVGMFGSVHEGPQNLRPKDLTVFRAGMTITNEPGVYEEGRFGIRTENLMVTKKAFSSEYGKFLRFETLTCFPIDTAPVLVQMLSDAELEWLNSYNRSVRERLMPLLPGKEAEWLQRKTQPLQREG